MEISIGSYSARLEIVLLIVILLILIFGHTLCSCSTMSFKEGFHALGSSKILEGLTTGPMATAKPKPVPVMKKAEGFSNLRNSAFDTQFADNNSNFSYMNPTQWDKQTLVYSKGTTPSAGVQSIWDRSKTQKPPIPGQISFFDNINFDSSCCQNSDASSSDGCACYTVEDYNMLKTRGGNTTLNSEF
jgi:hypothetical protein